MIRMQRDLKRALQKKPEDIKWGMVIAPLLPAPPEGRYAAGLHHLVYRPRHHLR
ncbi:MAG: hypothetical protein WC600_05170 [Desulfobaccales bacterium]